MYKYGNHAGYYTKQGRNIYPSYNSATQVNEPEEFGFDMNAVADDGYHTISNELSRTMVPANNQYVVSTDQYQYETPPQIIGEDGRVITTKVQYTANHYEPSYGVPPVGRVARVY